MTDSVTLGAKVSPEVALAVDRAVSSYPRAFKDRSEFVRVATTRLLRELGFSNRPVLLRRLKGQEPADGGVQ